VTNKSQTTLIIYTPGLIKPMMVIFGVGFNYTVSYLLFIKKKIKLAPITKKRRSKKIISIKFNNKTRKSKKLEFAVLLYLKTTAVIKYTKLPYLLNTFL
jgi:hypothetical protein